MRLKRHQEPPAKPPSHLSAKPGWRLPAALHQPGAWALLTTTAAIEFARGALFIVLLPAFLPGHRHLSPEAVGLVVSAQYLADIIFKTVGGAFADRRGPWLILVPTLAVSAIAAAAIPSANRFSGLMLLAFLFGIGAATNWPAAAAGLARMGGEGAEGAALSLVFVAWLGGGGLGPVLSSFLVSRSYGAAFHLVAVVALIAPLAALVALFGHFGPGPAPSVTGMPHAQPHTSLAAIWNRLLDVRLLLPPLFLQTVALGMLLPVALPFAHNVLRLPTAAFGVMLLVGGGATVLSLPLFGSLVDRYGWRWFLIGGLTAAGVVLGWLALAPGDRLELLLRILCLGAAYAAILPAWNKLLLCSVPEPVRATFMGLFMAVEGVGVATGPMIGGFLWTHAAPTAPFVGSAALIVAMALYYTVVPASYLEEQVG